MRINDFHNILELVKQDILQSEAEYLKLLKVVGNNQMHIPLRRSRQSGVAGATGPDYRSHLCIGSIVTVPEPDPYHKLLSWICPWFYRCTQY